MRTVRFRPNADFASAARASRTWPTTQNSRIEPKDAGLPLLPWIDPENFNPGYLMRGMHLLPKHLDKSEWQHAQDYWAEKDEFPAIDLTDAAFRYR